MTNSSPVSSANLPKFTLHFERVIATKKKKDLGLARAIRDVIPKVLENPQGGDGHLRGPHAGKRKWYIGKSGYRVVFIQCKECRTTGHAASNVCTFCDQTPDNTVVFFGGYVKKGRHEDYDLPRVNTNGSVVEVDEAGPGDQDEQAAGCLPPAS